MQAKGTDKKAWVITVDMGYGHQRTAYPLRDLAFSGKVINANNYEGIPDKDKQFWNKSRSAYEFVSRFRRVPIVGMALFLFLDSFQRILGYYPKRDLSGNTLGSKSYLRFIKRGWLKDLVMRLKKNPLPIVSTFFSPALAADYFKYPNQVYCVICDTDVNRAWVAKEPKKSHIKYFASCTWSQDRLKLYGVPEENIILTGYPLPKENIGGADMSILKRDLAHRLVNLDPEKRYRKLYAPLIKTHFGELPKKADHPLTIMFSIGGAGAQKEIALEIINSLKEHIKKRKLRFIISIGTRKELGKYFTDNVEGMKFDEWLSILSGDTMEEYFKAFNVALRTTDILMTKPSELSFYAGLGIPIIIEPPVGSQEDFNKRWLMHMGVAIQQENPKYTDQWFFDELATGDFAEMAMQGFIEVEKMGTYHIENIIAGKKI